MACLGSLAWLDAMFWAAVDSRVNLKISKESGFSGVAAVMPKVLPAGRLTYGKLVNLEFFSLWLGFGTYLVGREADLVIHSHLEERVGVLQLHHGGPTQVAVGVVTVSESKAVDAAVALVVCCAIVQKSTNTSAPSTVRINDESEAIKLAHGVNAGRANTSLPVFGIP